MTFHLQVRPRLCNTVTEPGRNARLAHAGRLRMLNGKCEHYRYEFRLQAAIDWLGDRYVLAKPQVRPGSERRAQVPVVDLLGSLDRWPLTA